MNTLIKAVEACRAALARSRTAGLRIIEIAASPARPNSYRGVAESHAGAARTRVGFSCRVDGHRATVASFADRG